MTRPMPYTSGADKKANGPNAINVRAIQTTNTGISGAVADTILDGFFQRRNSNPRSLRRCAFKESAMKEIPLTQGYVALIDDEDFESVKQYKWLVVKGWNTWYGGRDPHKSEGGTKRIMLHRALMNAPDGFQVDHKDGNGLNCQKYNLRVCTKAENARNRDKQYNNTSGYKGVFWNTKAKRWYAKIAKDSKQYFAGNYDTREEAARAYDKKALELHGEFALLNFPVTV